VKANSIELVLFDHPGEFTGEPLGMMRPAMGMAEDEASSR
jgi:hypothetical protein